MDNMTHSLVGAAIAQGAIQYRRHRLTTKLIDHEATPPQSEAHGATEDGTSERIKAAGFATLPMYMTSILANNFPDLDLLITAFMDPRLGYILHHRGHTHTLLFTPLQVLMLLGLLWLYGRRKKITWTVSDWRWFGGLALVGGLVHLGMDSWNVYGVHPFWPLDNRWYYGDFVFILEPLFWFALIPWLSQSVTQRWSRNLLLVVYSLGLVALSVVYFRFWWYPLGVVIVAMSYGMWVRSREDDRTKGLATLAAMLLLIGCLLGSSLWVRGTLTTGLKRLAPQEKVHDIALMSYPSNPFCYQWVSVAESPKDNQYVLRKGIYSVAPRVFRCPVLNTTQTAPLQRSIAPFKVSTGGFIGPQMEFRRPLQELKAMAGHCQVEAAMQFIRTPYWQLTASHVQIGDVRFDRRKEFDLAEFRFPKKPTSCPSLLPPWVAPLRSHGIW